MFTALALFAGRIVESVEGFPTLSEAKKAARELRSTLLGENSQKKYCFAVRKPNGMLTENLADVSRQDRMDVQAQVSRIAYRPIA